MCAACEPPVARRAGWFTPPRLIMAVFFAHAVSITNWAPRIPDVQQRLGLSPGQLSICLLSMSLGTFVMTIFNGPLIARFSARTMMAIGICAFCAVLILPGLAWDGPTLFVFLFVMGASFVITDVAMNVEAARIQDAVGRRIMSTCHGFWSMGAVVGSVMSGQFAEASVPTWLHLLIVGIIVLPLGLLPIWALPVLPAAQAVPAGKRPIIAFPTVALAGLCIYVFGAVLAELSARNWGAAYLRDTLGTSAAATGWGLGAFSLTMAVGRLAGDRLTDRFGPVALGRICAFTAVAGMAALVAANGLLLALIGFAAIGFGVSAGFPLAVTAAAGYRDRPPAINVASVALIAYSGSLVGPPLVGFVADGAGLRVGLASLLPLMVLSALFAGALAPPKPAPRTINDRQGG
jgi:MFS family permease